MLVRDPITGKAVNPRLVYALEVLKATLVPRVYTSSVTFQAGAAGASLTSTLNERVPTDTIIKRVEFTIRQPNMFAGNIFKPQRDSYLLAATQFNVEAESFGGPPSECVEITVDGPMPLEHFAMGPGVAFNNWVNPWGDAFWLPQDMNIRINTISVNALAGNEAPTTVFYTFKVDQIDGCCLRTIPMEEAVKFLSSSARIGR